MSLFLSPLVYHFSFYLVCLRLASGSPFSPTICLSTRWKEREKRIVHSVWSRDRDISPDSPLSVEVSSSVRPAGTKKKKEARPSARGCSCDCIRKIAIYGCRHCAAGYPFDAEGSERSSRENCPFRHDPANRDFPVCRPLSLLKILVRAIGPYDKTWRQWWLLVWSENCIGKNSSKLPLVSCRSLCHLFLISSHCLYFTL